MIGTVNSEAERLLAQGQDAARKGDKAGARSFLTQVVERDPHNELAWMWLSGVVETPEEQQICLENVLVINPQNDKARRGLDFISTQTGIPAHLPIETEAPTIDASEYTSPLSSDSPMYNELGGHQSVWGSTEDYTSPQAGSGADEGEDASLAFLAFMQNASGGQQTDPASDALASYMQQFDAQGESSNSQVPSWGGQPQPLHQEQLDWGQPGDQFNVLSIADGVDDRLAGFDTLGGNLPPWADGGGSDTSPGLEPFSMSPMGATPGAALGGMSSMGPMGLHSDSNLPSPSDLPKFDEPTEQPWYLKSSDQQSSPELDKYGSSSRSSSSTSDGLKQSASMRKDMTAMVDCPNCKATVADTSLSCPQCKYSFFVNCPHCHELVDAVDAKEGKSEPCPYCQKPINRMELGLAGTDSAISYKSTRASSDSMSKQAMDDIEASHKIKAPVSFRWLTDVAWLVVIVAIVWALSQIPTWLHLAGQY